MRAHGQRGDDRVVDGTVFVRLNNSVGDGEQGLILLLCIEDFEVRIRLEPIALPLFLGLAGTDERNDRVR